ncbi:MAG: hypothetical protein NUV56_02735, partial [Candidatus Uhrbacteria bacterium]|nr:hypothetical protein [Candidatus Uhrbacteria bacterium]
MQFFVLSVLLDKSKHDRAFLAEFMQAYGPGSATRAVYDRDAEGTLLLGFDNTPGAGPAKDGATDLLRVAKLTGGDSNDVLIKRQELTSKVREMSDDEQIMIGEFFADVYLTTYADAIFQAES